MKGINLMPKEESEIFIVQKKMWIKAVNETN